MTDTPTTPTGKRIAKANGLLLSGKRITDNIVAIEREAAAAERERQRAKPVPSKYTEFGRLTDEMSEKAKRMAEQGGRSADDRRDDPAGCLQGHRGGRA